MGRLILFHAKDKERVNENMCTTLEKLRNKTPEYLLYKETELGNNIPIDINALLKSVGIIGIPHDFSKIEETSNVKKGDIYGAIFVDGEDIGIFYNKYDNFFIQRFTIAHELAHCCIHTDEVKKRHIDFRSESTKKLPRELEANTFAGELLMPKRELLYIYKNSLVEPNIQNLANFFQVPEKAMKKRLKYLQLI